MSVLSEFVGTLLPPERAVLSQLGLRGKQREILKIIIEDPNDEKKIECKARELEMTSSHLYSTLSMLLQRAYRAFVPEGGVRLLLFLQGHGLPSHFKKELQQQEAELKKNKVCKEQLHQFYLRVLHILAGTTIMRFDRRVYQGVLQLYLRTNPDPQPADLIHGEICEVMGALLIAVVNPTRHDPTLAKQEIFEKLQDCAHRLQPYKHPLAQYHLAYTLFIYYSAFAPDPSKISELIETLSTQIYLLPESIRVDELPKLGLRLASYEFTLGNVKKAYKLYHQQYKSQGLEFFRPYGFHLDRFVRSAIVLKQFDVLDDLLQSGYTPTYSVGNNPIATSGAIYKAQAALLKNDLITARAELYHGFDRNKASQFVFALDLQLRFLEIIIEMKENKPEKYIVQLITRGIKHVHRKGMTIQSGGDVQLFYVLRDILTGNPKSETVNEYLATISVHPSVQEIVKDLIKEKARLNK